MSKKTTTVEKNETEITTPTEPQTFCKPRYSIEQGETGFELTAEIPGSSKKDVSITARDGHITIIAERSSRPEAWNPSYRETATADYQLVLKLNAPVDPEKIEAKVKDGLLSLTLPLREEAKPRSIKVG